MGHTSLVDIYCHCPKEQKCVIWGNFYNKFSELIFVLKGYVFSLYRPYYMFSVCGGVVAATPPHTDVF